MSTTTYSPFAPDPAESRGLNRAILWSVGVHVTIAAVVLLVPRAWWATARQKPPVMTISLGGTPGPRSTGTTSIGGRTIERAAPPPKRPEPIRPAPKEEPAPAAVKAVSRPEPKPAKAPPKREAPTPTRPPVTGPQVQAGSTAVETGAHGQGAGLTFGGGGQGGETDLASFCCPQYLQLLLSIIDGNWNKDQPTYRGTTVLKFVIQRDGRITNVSVKQSSGYGVLDRAARAALDQSGLPPLPPDYTNPTLTIDLTFPYGTQ